MNDKKVFSQWAPPHVRWTNWVRPVPFIGCVQASQKPPLIPFSIPDIHYISTLKKDTALLIDLPSYEGVLEALACTKIGYRPIPLYNGTDAPENAMALIDNTDIKRALFWGQDHLQNQEIAPDAPPAFIIDSNRLLRYKMNPSVFDNSWDLYNQDIPSPEYFKNNGIHNIIVRSDRIRRDCARILYAFQEKGIRILHTDGYQEATVVRLKKPPKKDKFH